MGSIRVTRSEPAASVELDNFLRRATAATVFHRPEWHAVLREAYGHRTDYWLAHREASLVGVFPVVEVARVPWGRKMIAMAYQMHSGLPLADDESVAHALIEAAAAHAKERRARWLEVRHHEPLAGLRNLGFEPMESGLCTTICDLRDFRQDRLSGGHWKDIKHARNRGVVIEEAKTLEDLRAFQRLYARDGRRMGSPQAGWRFLEAQWRLARPYTRLLLARHEGECVGGTLTLGDDRMVFGRCSAYSPEAARSLRVGKALYWRELSDAQARGCTSFSIGLSWTGDLGLIRAKEGWNARTLPVHLSVLPISKTPRPPGSYFEGYGLAKRAWRLLPLWITDRLGHRVTGWVC